MLTFYVIQTNAQKLPLAKHYAIKWKNISTGKDEVIHLCSKGAVREDYDTFIKSRGEIQLSTEYQCKGQQTILDYYYKHRSEKFNILSNNCEIFVNRFLKENGEKVTFLSPQRDIALLCLSAIVAAVIAVLIKKQIITKQKCESIYQNVKQSLSSAL